MRSEGPRLEPRDKSLHTVTRSGDERSRKLARPL